MEQQMEKELFITQLNDHLFLLDENHEATGYLLIGEEKACVIDTMNGYSDLHEVVKLLTDKPLVVVNTHGHPDHIFGNVYFDKAYMNPLDFELSKQFTNDPKFLEKCEENHLSMPPFEELHEGDVIDLGGKTLKVYALPGHTPGSVLLLCPEDRILFVGDSINHHLWMQIPGCSSLTEFAKNLEKVLFLEKEADVILHGHSGDFDDISLMRSLYEGVLEIIEGKTNQDTPYQWFGGEAMQHPFSVDPNGHFFLFKQHVICYQKDNI